MWTRNNDVPNRNMLKHFIYSSSSKSATSPLCSPYYRYSSELSSSFCILSFLVIATSIDQTFYSATHYLAAVWLDSRHDFNNIFNTSSRVIVKKNHDVKPRSSSSRLKKKLASRSTSSRSSWSADHSVTIQEIVDLSIFAQPLNQKILLLWECRAQP